MIKKRIVKLMVAVAVVSFGLVSCRKENPTLAHLTVVDIDGNRYAGAEVRIYGDPTLQPAPNAMIMDRTLYSDANGEVIFDFTDDFKLGSAGFAVLNVELTGEDGLSGEGIIKIEPEQRNTETFVIQLP